MGIYYKWQINDLNHWSTVFLGEWITLILNKKPAKYDDLHLLYLQFSILFCFNRIRLFLRYNYFFSLKTSKILRLQNLSGALIEKLDRDMYNSKYSLKFHKKMSSITLFIRVHLTSFFFTFSTEELCGLRNEERCSQQSNAKLQSYFRFLLPHMKGLEF